MGDRIVTRPGTTLEARYWADELVEVLARGVDLHLERQIHDGSWRIVIVHPDGAEITGRIQTNV